MKTRKRIQEKVIKAMAAKLAKVMHPEQIYLFGSYAWGKPTKDSDVDFCLVFDKVKPQQKIKLMYNAQKAVEEFDFPKDIIVRDADKMARMRGYISPLEGKIQSQGVKLYDAVRRNR